MFVQEVGHLMQYKF